MVQTKLKENAFTFYQRTAAKTAREDYDLETDPRHARVAIASMGLAGETGELIDMLKKWAGHGHELNLDDVEKELGDILWYISEIATTLDLRLAQIAERNEEKLNARYPDGFSVKNSINRVDTSR
ncbi:MazG Predicted pyrophosphatase [uncultured Caudovirales phage]|uniref:MazG Predicted pyrophosphatase n=1 Tax=uncultured Caudovirales phage TaxID=2100421 RepID=A0A6J5MR16_9CAUD|nr:MazG Predicted pyrophosphatase [uncultured Caudovirales phage]CAB4190702.1 MazG Predicted pyrophosphatase [uncultured Caudovirales phage]CAB4194486.1 MazG Predicted pyrophosphatase [uncultured Caudovirales phage]